MIEEHWGQVLDSEVPTTGVFNANDIEFIWDEIDSAIDLTFEEALSDHKQECIDEDCIDEDHLYFYEGYESDNPMYLIGFKQAGDGLWDPDESSEYSAILRQENGPILQVVASKWVIRGALCSPCYPGQVDGDTDGKFLAFAPPPSIVGDNKKLRKRIKKVGL